MQTERWRVFIGCRTGKSSSQLGAVEIVVTNREGNKGASEEEGRGETVILTLKGGDRPDEGWKQGREGKMLLD